MKMDSKMDAWKNLKDAAPDTGFDHRIRRRLETHLAHRRRFRWWAGASISLAAAGILFALVVVPPRPHPAPRVVLAQEDMEIEDEIEQILYDPVLYSELLIDEVFSEVDEEAEEKERSYQANPEGFTYS